MLKHTKKYILRFLRGANRIFDLRAWLLAGESGPHPLAGDRAIEWSWIVAKLPSRSGVALDLGCVDSVLSGIASRLGHSVVAVDLREIEYEMQGVTFVKGDFNVLDFGHQKFDTIMNCSMIEHVGLAGRYDSPADPNGDLSAMRKLLEVLAPGGIMIMTIPVGVDAIFSPWHRIYGRHRLESLVAGYTVLDEEFWFKAGTGRWQRCTREHALSLPGSERAFALGLFVLSRASA